MFERFQLAHTDGDIQAVALRSLRLSLIGTAAFGSLQHGKGDITKGFTRKG